MKLLPSFVAAVLLLIPACGEKANAAMGDAQKMANQLANKAINTTWGELGKSLAGIKDGATADKAKAALATMVGAFKTQLGGAGGLEKWKAMLGADGQKSITDQITKLMNNAEIKKSIGPVLEQLKAALAGN